MLWKRTLAAKSSLLASIAATCFLAPNPAASQDVGRYTPQPLARDTAPTVTGPEIPSAAGDSSPLVRALKGVVIVGRPERISKSGTKGTGIVASALFAVITTAASCGAVNAMHDSFTALGGMIPLINMQLGDVIIGGVGAGLYGMLIFIIIAIFIA